MTRHDIKHTAIYPDFSPLPDQRHFMERCHTERTVKKAPLFFDTRSIVDLMNEEA